MVNKDELIKQLAKTQIALANSNPLCSSFNDISYTDFKCIHCGGTLDVAEPPKTQGHSDDCIWLLAVFATGDYP